MPFREPASGLLILVIRCRITNQPKTLQLTTTVILSHRFLGQEFGSGLAGLLENDTHTWLSSISWYMNLSIGLLDLLPVYLLDLRPGFPQRVWSEREPHEESTAFMPRLRSHTEVTISSYSRILHIHRSKWLRSTRTQMKGGSLALLEWRSSNRLWK